MANKIIVNGRIYEATASQKVIVSGRVFEETVATTPVGTIIPQVMNHRKQMRK